MRFTNVSQHHACFFVSQLKFADELSNMSKGTPLQLKVISETETTKCFSNVYNLASLQSKKDCGKFRNDIVCYCLEWESTVMARLDNEVVKSKQLLGTKLHYEDKLPSLRKKVYECEQKGSKAPASVLDKLHRNESKLKKAKNLYENHAFELVIQLEEAIICSWKDLFPLLQYMMTWESERASTEHKIFKNLQSSLLRELNDQYDEVKDYKAVRMSKTNTSSDSSDSYDENNDNDYESVNMLPDDDDAETVGSMVSKKTNSQTKPYKDVGFLDAIVYQQDQNDEGLPQQPVVDEPTRNSHQLKQVKSEPVVIKTLGSGRISKK
jgi:hypothetical protein